METKEFISREGAWVSLYLSFCEQQWILSLQLIAFEQLKLIEDFST